jgi:hypothetical protein
MYSSIYHGGHRGTPEAAPPQNLAKIPAYVLANRLVFDDRGLGARLGDLDMLDRLLPGGRPGKLGPGLAEDRVDVALVGRGQVDLRSIIRGRARNAAVCAGPG